MYCSLGFLDASRQLLWYCVHSLCGPRVAHITMNKHTYRSHLAYNCRCDFSIQLLCGAVTGFKEVATITNINFLSYVIIIIESVDSVSRDERDAPFMQYITNAGISHARYTITHFKHHHRVLWLIFNRISV